MLKEQKTIVARLLWLSDMSVTALAFLAAYFLRSSFFGHGDLGGLDPLQRYALLFVAVIVVWTVLLRQYGAYRSYRTVSLSAEITTVWKAVAIGAIVIGTVAFAFKFKFVSRTLIGIFLILDLLLLAGLRTGVRLLSWMVRERGYNFRNAVIVGTGRTARDLAEKMASHRHWGLRFLGFVSEEPAGTAGAIDGHPVIGDLSRLESMVRELTLDEVFIALSEKRIEELEDALLMLEENGVRTLIVPNFFPHLIAKLQLQEFETVPLLTFSTVPTDVLALYLKRGFDICASLALLALSAPILLVTALLIRATSPGPAIFRQQRCGLHGRVFTLYKFRSMHLDAEAKRKELELYNEMDGPVFKIRNDPRVTAVGRFIRVWSIDELPQFWNVFKGDMSIVGPRPPMVDEVASYQRWQRRRLSMRPGITCLWQISGRNEIRDFNDWVKLDLQYIDSWSLALDLKIFMKTVLAVVFRKGAA